MGVDGDCAKLGNGMFNSDEHGSEAMEKINYSSNRNDSTDELFFCFFFIKIPLPGDIQQYMFKPECIEEELHQQVEQEACREQLRVFQNDTEHS